MSEYPEEARENYMNRKLRLDADGDGEERREPTGSGGNTRLPYGLCEQFGIPLPKDAKPHDAWAALAGKGIKPEAVYKYLDVHGTVKGFQPEEKTSTGNNPVNKGQSVVSFSDKVEKLKITPSEKTAILDRQKQVDEFFKTVRDKMATGKPLGTKKSDDLPRMPYPDNGEFSALLDDAFGKYKNFTYDEDTRKAVTAVKRASDAIEKCAWLSWDLWNMEKQYEKYGNLNLYEGDIGSANGIVKKVQSWVDEMEDGEIKDWAKATVADYQKQVQQKTEFARSEKVKRNEVLEKIHKEDRSRDLAHTSTKRKTGIRQYTHFGDYKQIESGLRLALGTSVQSSIESTPGMTVEKANHMSDALQTVYEDYGFKPLSIGHGYAKKARASWSYYGNALSMVNLNTVSVNNPKHDYYSGTQNGFFRWTVDASVEGVTVHELGHGLMGNAGDADIMIGYVKEWNKVRNRLEKKHHGALCDGTMTWTELEEKTKTEFGKKGIIVPGNGNREGAVKWRAVSNAYARAKFNGDIHNLSEYGASDYEEFFAESFVQYKMGEEMPDYMVEMVELFLN